MENILRIFVNGAVIAIILGLISYFSNKVAKKKSCKKAIKECCDAINTNPNDATAYCNRGIAKFELKDFNGAIEDYNMAISLDSQYSDAYSLRGIIKLELGDKQGACMDWKEASKLGLEAADELIKKYCN